MIVLVQTSIFKVDILCDVVSDLLKSNENFFYQFKKKKRDGSRNPLIMAAKLLITIRNIVMVR